jgi:flotillin
VQLTVVSTDGASQLTKNVAGGFSEIDAVLKSTTGLDIRSLLGSFAGGAAAGTVAAHAAQPTATVTVPRDVSMTLPKILLEPTLAMHVPSVPAEDTLSAE